MIKSANPDHQVITHPTGGPLLIGAPATDHSIELGGDFDGQHDHGSGDPDSSTHHTNYSALPKGN